MVSHEGLGIVDVGIFKHVSMYVCRTYILCMYVCMYVDSTSKGSLKFFVVVGLETSLGCRLLN
jgi:hypothetical protein